MNALVLAERNNRIVFERVVEIAQDEDATELCDHLSLTSGILGVHS